MGNDTSDLLFSELGSKSEYFVMSPLSETYSKFNSCCRTKDGSEFLFHAKDEVRHIVSCHKHAETQAVSDQPADVCLIPLLPPRRTSKRG